ncbi:MAG: DUF2780 domain-containing protein [Pyrinomonadaceae bacterium]
MRNKVRITLLAICCFACFGTASAQQPEPLPKAQAPATQVKGLTNPSPELVGNLTKELSITPEQAIGGAGALFGAAKSKLKPEDFLKVANVVPGMDGLLKAAPKPRQKGTEGTDLLGSVGSMLPGKVGAIASTAGAFKQLGIPPETAIKFLPIMTKFVDLKGGAGVAKVLSGALK